MGYRKDVLYDCGTKPSCTYVANGVGWYFSNKFSWGFVSGNESITRNQCDMTPINGGLNGLCWHTGSYGSGGYQCGSVIKLNQNQSYERLIYHSD